MIKHKLITGTEELNNHLLLHLQSVRRHLDVKMGAPDLDQIAFDIYEIGEHLGFSPKEINDDVKEVM